MCKGDDYLEELAVSRGSENDIVYCDKPNMHAPVATLEWQGETAIVHGYQDFKLSSSGIASLPVNLNHCQKAELLQPYFTPRFLRHRTLLDLGANAGFFSFWALQQGAESAIVVEMDNAYADIVLALKDRLNFPAIHMLNCNVTECKVKADVVLALALVHWVYSCTASFGDLERTVEWLAGLTEYMLVVEWIEPDDPAIAFFGHTEWNKAYLTGPYTREVFEGALHKFFRRVELIGHVSPTRWVYVAYLTDHEIDLSGPLPLLMDKERLVSSRFLVTNPYTRTDYWSCVYDEGESILKQATLDLADREAYFLRQFESPYFPRVLKTQSFGDYSVIGLEKVSGWLLSTNMTMGELSPADFHTFAQDCLNILSELAAKGVFHRDIRPQNLLIRDVCAAGLFRGRARGSRYLAGG